MVYTTGADTSPHKDLYKSRKYAKKRKKTTKKAKTKSKRKA